MCPPPDSAGGSPPDPASADLFRVALENATDAIGMSTPQGRHYYQNPAFTRLFGDIGEDPPKTLYADQEVGEAVFHAIMAGGQWTAEVRMHARDGRILNILLRAFASKDDTGRILSLVGIHTDITERRQAEEALRLLNEELEARVAERTALAERRAAQLRALAGKVMQAERRERQRIAHVLHEDLQQILVGAQYHLHGLQDLAPDRIGRVQEMLRQVLALSQSLTASLSPTVLCHAGLQMALHWLARQMKELHGLDVALDLRAEVPRDDNDLPELLFHAVRELLLNVVKHAAVRQARVVLDRDGDGALVIEVVDVGAGFEVPATPFTEHGIGLVSIREHLDDVGGTLSIDSAPGAGTRARMVIPA